MKRRTNALAKHDSSDEKPEESLEDLAEKRAKIDEEWNKLDKSLDDLFAPPTKIVRIYPNNHRDWNPEEPEPEMAEQPSLRDFEKDVKMNPDESTSSSLKYPHAKIIKKRIETHPESCFSKENCGGASEDLAAKWARIDEEWNKLDKSLDDLLAPPTEIVRIYPNNNRDWNPEEPKPESTPSSLKYPRAKIIEKRIEALPKSRFPKDNATEASEDLAVKRARIDAEWNKLDKSLDDLFAPPTKIVRVHPNNYRDWNPEEPKSEMNYPNFAHGYERGIKMVEQFTEQRANGASSAVIKREMLLEMDSQRENVREYSRIYETCILRDHNYLGFARDAAGVLAALETSALWLEVNR